MTTPVCANCGRWLAEGHQTYTMKIELFASVEDPLVLSEKDLAADLEQEMKALIEKLGSMSDVEVRREEERVYSVYTFTLCPPCRDLLAGLLRGHLATS